MTKVAVEHTFTGPTGAYSEGYDPTKTLLGQWIVQKTGPNNTDKYAGPGSIAVLRPYEGGTINPNFPTQHPYAIDAGNGIHWVFHIESSTAANNVRKISLSTFDTTTQTWNIKGWITCTFPTASGTALVPRGLAIQRHLYITGTVSGASGSTSITGIGTGWQTARYAVGARIGFGSTDPNEIHTWYYISAIGSDTGITLSSALLNAVPPGSSFVIDELRIYVAAAGGATVAGLLAVKGITFDDFNSSGTAIASASTTDNVKACYWLADAATVQSTFASGICLSSDYSDTSQYAYLLDGSSTTWRVYKHDVRAALTNITAGKVGTPFASYLYRTASVTASGTLSPSNAWCFATTQHGPGAGVPSLYGTSTSSGRVVRIPENLIVDGTTSGGAHHAENMRDLSPLGSPGLTVGNNVAVQYLPNIDRFFVSNIYRAYITKYVIDGSPFERVFSFDTKQIDQISAAVGLTPMPSNSTANAGGLQAAAVDGWLYISRNTTTQGAIVAASQTYAIPFGSDWSFAPGSDETRQNRLISPELSTPGCKRFYRVIASHAVNAGSSTFGLPPEPFKIYYRTAGIDDNTGAWNLVSENGDISGVGPASSIQFMFEFRIIGPFTIPAKIYGLTCTYENDATDAHFQPSVNFTDKNFKRFAWRFATAFGTTVPTLTVSIYESTTNVLLLRDTTAAELYGEFEKSIDGGFTWTAYNTTDKANDKTYIRYIPTSLANNLKVKMVLTQ